MSDSSAPEIGSDPEDPSPPNPASPCDETSCAAGKDPVAGA